MPRLIRRDPSHPQRIQRLNQPHALLPQFLNFVPWNVPALQVRASGEDAGREGVPNIYAASIMLRLNPPTIPRHILKTLPPIHQIPSRYLHLDPRIHHG